MLNNNYIVTFIGFEDEEGLPIRTEIKVPIKYQKQFENFLNKNQDEIFSHANGGKVEF